MKVLITSGRKFFSSYFLGITSNTNLISKCLIGYCNYFVLIQGEKSCYSISSVNIFQRSRCVK